MKNAGKIFSVLLAAAFLVPSVGVWINRHTCIRSGEVQVSLVVNHSCCCNAILQTSAEKSACGPSNGIHTNNWEESHRKCCMNESSYIKTKDRYYAPVKTEIPGPDTRIAMGYLIPVPFSRDQQVIEKREHPPPGGLPSRNLFSLHTLLLI